MAEKGALGVDRIPVGPLSTNCYVVWRDGSTVAAVIDPAANPARIAERLEQNGLTCGAIIILMVIPTILGPMASCAG